MTVSSVYWPTVPCSSATAAPAQPAHMVEVGVRNHDRVKHGHVDTQRAHVLLQR